MQLLMPILIGGFAPAVICVLSLLAVSLIKPGVLRKRLAALATPLVVGLAFLPVEYAAHGFPDLWPPDSTYRLAHIALMATAFVLLGTLIKRPRLAHTVLTLAPFPITAWVLLETLHPHYLDASAMAAWIVAIGAAGTAGNVVMTHLARGSGRAPALAALTLTAGGIAACSMIGHSATVAQLGAGLAAIASGSLLAKLIRPRVRFSAGGFTVYLVLLAALLVMVHHFVELPISATLILAASPFAGGIAGLPIIRSRRPAIGWIMVLGAATAGPSLAAWITYASQSAVRY